MRIVTLLLSGLFAVSTHAATVRLGKDVVPRAQRVELRLDPASDSYGGVVDIDLDVRKPVTSFALHAEDIEVSSVTVNGAAATFAMNQPLTLTITPAKRLERGPAAMRIEFTNQYNRQAVGLYKVVKDGVPYLYTQFEAIDARKAFPVWDEPEFKIPFQLTITAPKPLVVVSNTPVTSESEEGDWKTVHFARTRPLPSYLVALAVGPFEVMEIPGMRVPGQVLAPKGQKALTRLAIDYIPPVLAELEKYFGSPYPFEKVGLIAVPDYWFGAMENPGLITFRDTIILLDENTATPSQRRNLARIIAHELAHMWFGDLVTMRWWDDFWLNESFADWMGDKVTDKVFPQFNLGMSELQSIQSAMSTDARPSTDAIRNRNAEPLDAMRNVSIAYDKGKAVLGMFEEWMGPEKFRQGVLDYLRVNSWGNAASDDLWRSLGKYAPKGTVPALESFVDQAGVPLVRVTRSGPNQVTLTQKRFAAAGVTVKPQTWKVPVTLRYSDGTTPRTHSVLLDVPSKTINLEGQKIDWVLPNADARGYYRWQVPEEQLTMLGGRAGEILTPRERLAFVGNLGALLQAGSIHADTYLETLARLANDTNPQVISAISTALSGVKAAFITPETATKFATLVQRTFGPTLERIGMTAKPGEDPLVTILRPTLLTWLGDTAKDPKVVEFARAQAAAYLADPKSVDSTIVGTILRLNALHGDEATFEEYKKRFETATTPTERGRFLSSLGAFRDPKIRAAALEYALKGPLRPQETFTIPFGGGDSIEERDQTFRWVTTNYDFIVSRVPLQFLGSLPFIGGGCDAERLAKTREFFATRKVEGTEKTLERISEQVNECVTLRAREMAGVSRYLDQFTQ